MSVRRSMKAALAAAASLFLFAEISFSSSSPASPAAFDAAFARRTMRLDLFHTGGPKGEVVAVAGAGAVDDGPWAGSLTRLLDDTNLGTHFFEVRRPEVEPRPLLARILFALRRVGDDARVQENLADVPRVAALPVAEGAGAGRPLAARRRERLPAHLLDAPSTPSAANPAPRAALGKVWTVFENGPATGKLDLLVLGEGYAEKDLPKFHSDVKRLVDLLFSYEPFKSRRARLQRPRARPAVGRDGRPPARLEDLPAHAALGPVRDLRLGALRPHVRRPRAARRGRRRRRTTSSRSS